MTAFGQAPAARPPASSDEVVELSPFSVTGDQERGYAATSTLSGTRLKTSLKDTAAAISVITPELLQDLGLNDVNQIASFMTNTEVDPNQPNNAFNMEQNNASGIRIRGVTSTGSQANFFSIPFTIDSYNIDRLTQTRGPNSLLFGVGNVAGNLSSSTNRAALTKDRVAGKTSVSIDENNSRRASVDLQIPIVRNRAALRVDALGEKRRGFMDYDQRQEKRLYLTGTVKLADFKNYQAKFTAMGEWARADRLLPDQTTPQDGITTWIAAGRPTVAGTASAGNAANLPAGTARAASAARLVVIDGSPASIPVLNWNNTARGAPVSSTLNYRLGPNSPIDLYTNIHGGGVASDYRGRDVQFFFEQTFFRDFSLELASSRTNWDLHWVRSSSFQVDVDTNQNLPNGQPNPNVGKFYTENTFRLQAENRTSSEDRATLAYTFDGDRYSRWLGNWVVAGLLNRYNNTQGLDDSFMVNTTPLPGFNSNVSNSQNRIAYRTYLFEGAKAWLPAANYGHDLPVITAAGITPALKNTRSVNDLTSVEGWTLGTQAKLLQDHLVLTYGQRHDSVKRFTASPAPNADGFYNHWTTFARPQVLAFSADTQTFGAVAHVNRWVSAFYNKSESIDFGSPRLDILGNALPVPGGKGKDYGLKFSFLGDRLNATVSRYDSRSVNLSTNPASGLPAQIGLIEDATGLSINILNRGEQPPDTQDSVSTGYETEITCNPTESWRIMVNASRLDNRLSNVNRRYQKFLETRVFPLQAKYGSVVTASGDTVDKIINSARAALLNYHNAQEGAPANELRKWSFNLVTSYAFTQGSLRGVSFGGSAQYRAPNVLALRLDSTGNPIPSQRIMGDSLFTFGAHLRYEHKLMKRYLWSAQLNVFNLFDKNLFVRKAADPVTGNTTGWGLRQPRTFQLSTSVGF